MTSSQFDSRQIAEKYRLLGLPINADREMLRKQRNKLIMKFHPDRHPDGWSTDRITLEQRMQLIQEAYHFIMTHFDAIQLTLVDLQEHCLTQQTSRVNRSHWIYTEVASYGKNHCENKLLKKPD